MKQLSWRPRKYRGVYCSSACGHGCKHRWFLSAQKNAHWLCKQLPGFKPRVHENMGWFWAATRGSIRISPNAYEPSGSRLKEHGYFASYGAHGILAEGRTPLSALKNLHRHFENILDTTLACSSATADAIGRVKGLHVSKLPRFSGELKSRG